MSPYEEFENPYKKQQEPRGSTTTTKSIVTIAVSVVLTTVIIGILFSILMNRMIKTTHDEINTKFAGSDIGSSINSFIKNATKWIDSRARNVNISLPTDAGSTENSSSRQPLPFFGNNGNFFQRFMNAVGDAFSKNKFAPDKLTTVAPESSTSVYRLSR